MTAPRRGVLLVLLLSAGGCYVHDPTPGSMPRDARAGAAPPGLDTRGLCGAWQSAVGPGDRFAAGHVSYPELDRRACFVPVRYDDGPLPSAGTIPEGCGYVPRDASPVLVHEAERYERIAAGDVADLPLELACALAPEARSAAALVNARTLRALAARTDERVYAYSVAATFGYGRPSHGATPLAHWLPGDACPADGDVDLTLFGVNAGRAGRAALALGGGVAPVVSFSGGAIHSAVTEAFLLDYIATCRLAVPQDRVLLDPCADHTHTNVRNTGRLVVALGARTAYLVTDDGLQSGYLQEWTAFDLIGGSIDQRSLRDWGYVAGSWRQASVGMRSGFWFSPFRFWADPRLRDLTCDGPKP